MKQCIKRGLVGTAVAATLALAPAAPALGMVEDGNDSNNGKGSIANGHPPDTIKSLVKEVANLKAHKGLQQAFYDHNN